MFPVVAVVCEAEQGCRLPPRSGRKKQLPISPSPPRLHHRPVVGDFMSELVIIMGDWVLTFFLCVCVLL